MAMNIWGQGGRACRLQTVPKESLVRIQETVTQGTEPKARNMPSTPSKLTEPPTNVPVALDVSDDVRLRAQIPPDRISYNVSPLEIEPSPIVSVFVAAPGNRPITASRQSVLSFLDYSGGLRPFKFVDVDEKKHTLNGISATRNGSLVVAFGDSPTPLLYDRNGELRGSLRQGYQYMAQETKTRGHTDSVTYAFFRQRGSQELVTCSVDSTIRLFDMRECGHDLLSHFCFAHRRKGINANVRPRLTTVVSDTTQPESCLLFSADADGCLFAIDTRSETRSRVITSGTLAYSYYCESEYLRECKSIVVLGNSVYARNGEGVVTMWDTRMLVSPLLRTQTKYGSVMDNNMVGVQQSMFVNGDNEILIVCHGTIETRTKLDSKFNSRIGLLAEPEKGEMVERKANDAILYVKDEATGTQEDYRRPIMQKGFISFLAAKDLSTVMSIELEDIPICGCHECGTDQYHFGTYSGQILSLYHKGPADEDLKPTRQRGVCIGIEHDKHRKEPTETRELYVIAPQEEEEEESLDLDEKDYRMNMKYYDPYGPHTLPLGHGRQGRIGVAMSKYILDQVYSKKPPQ